jgi:putative ABC transport system permease protein
LLWLNGLIRDLEYGFRMIRNARLVSIAVTLTLAVGIGINTGIFTIINGMLLRPRTDSDPATFARLYAQYWSQGKPREFAGAFSPAAYRAIQQRLQSLTELAAWRTDRVLIGDEPTGGLALEVSCNFFSVYGLTAPLSGRLFRASECAPGTEERVVVVGAEAWRDRFAADPHILGKTILLNRQSFSVVGIAPPNFSGRLRGPGIWVPYTTQHRLTSNEDIFVAELVPSLWLEGRLLPHHSRDQLQAEANVIMGQVSSQDRDVKQRVLVTNGAMIEDPIIRAHSFWIVLLILTGAMLLLLISCTSGSVLLLSRAIARQREIAVRISLGAAPWRIVRQLLSENLLIAVAAGVLGIFLALEIPQVFRKLIPQLPYFPFTLDWHIFGYLATITLASSIVAGLAPALECLKQDVWVSLKGHELTSQAGRVRWTMRDLLVVVQVCFCMVLMVVSFMFSQAVLSLFAMEPGFETRHVLAVPLQFSPERYAANDAEVFLRRLQDRIAGISQVGDVATSSMTPLADDEEGSAGGAEFRLPTQVSAEGHPATVRAVSRNYFSTLGIPFVRGDGFPSSDSDDSAVVISQAFAAVFWPQQDPVGQVVVSADGKRLRVVSVVRDNHTGYTNDPDGATLYTRKKPSTGDLMLVRFHGNVVPVAAEVNRHVHDLDPQMLVLPTTLRAQIDENAEHGWLIGKMLLFVAGVAVILALLGIYGMVGYSVTRRTREFGIRAAMGATPKALMRVVFATGARPVIAGIIVGIAVAFGFSSGVVRVFRQAPIPLSSTSPVPYGIVALSLTLAALTAMIGHARRAARIEPLTALREE